MSMIAPKTEGKARELVPTGNHVGILYGITYIGTINTGYKNEDGSDKWQAKVRLTFELPHELRQFGEDTDKKPMSISREVTFSLYKSEKQTAELRKIAHALLGQALTDQEAENFDIDDLLGRACMVEVVHETMKDGGTFAKPVTFSSIPKGMTVPPQFNTNKVVNVSTLTMDEMDALPEFIRNKMVTSREWTKRFESKIPGTNVPYPQDEYASAGEDTRDIPPLTDEDVPFN